MVSLDTRAYMYLRPTSTGVYDWVSINRANGMVIQRSSDVVITDGNQNLNSEKGIPNRARFVVHDPSGHLNRKNPLGAYWGSVGLGVRTRLDVLRVDDQFARTVADTNWGSVGNTDGDTWTAGTSSGGSVLAADWSVSGGTARHSLPVAGSYRLSELSKVDRPFTNIEVLTPVTCPTSNVTGTGALATEVWLRTVDISNFLAVSLAYMPDETLQIAIYDRTAGVNRYLLNYTTLTGLSLTNTTDYLLRCHAEGGTVRAKVWESGDPEPLDWQAIGNDAVIREGYLSIADYAFSGNTNTFPLVFQHAWIEVSIPVFTGEVTDLVPSGEDKTELKTVEVQVAGILDRLQTSKAPAVSALRRSRSGTRTWLYLGLANVVSATTRSVTVATSDLDSGALAAGDFLFLATGAASSTVKEDTKFVVTGTSIAGANTVINFTPDAREAATAGEFVFPYRATTASIAPIAYWPMEDGDDATQISSGLVGGSPMSIVNTPNFGAESGFLASAPILQLNDAELTATIPDHTDTGVITVSFLLAMPASDEGATSSDLVQFYTSGTGYSWDIQYEAAGNGSLQLLVFNSALTLLYDTGTIDFGLRGTKKMITLVLKQVGGTVTYALFAINNGTGVVGGTGPTTVTGVTTLGKINQIRINPGGGYDNVAFGHLAVVAAEWSHVNIGPAFGGWASHNAVRRFMRLCHEENIPFSYRSHWDLVSTSVGPQRIDKIGKLIKQPAESDDGFLIGARGDLALEYITRGALANLEPMAEFDVTLGHVKRPFAPTLDYAEVENLVTVERIDGTTAVSELTTGALSTQDPPNGVRVRDGGQYQLSLGSDTQAQLHADWRRSKGTVDQYRLPRLEVTAAGANAISIERLLSLGVGARVDVLNLDNLNIHGPLEQLINGYSLRLGQREYPAMTLVCSPYEVYYAFGIALADRSRPDMYDTLLGSTLTTTQTGAVTLTSATNHLVTTDAADFPLNLIIEGEEITLSAVSGDVSPQTGTIPADGRSKNGVVKSHAVGESVLLYRPNRYQFR